MTMSWTAEIPAYWDENKARIIGEAEPGIFDARFKTCRVGTLVPGMWWRVEQDSRTVGYAWMDVVWGDAEIVLATDPSMQGQGVGSFALDQLAHEARRRGLHRLYNIVRPTHPHGKTVSAWLQKRGFLSSEDGTLYKEIRSAHSFAAA